MGIQTRGQKKYEKTSSVMLAQYAFKIQTYINDLRNSLTRLSVLRQYKESNPELFEENPIDFETIGPAISSKYNEAIEEYNDMQKELEYRCAKDIGFKFEYYQMFKYQTEVDKLYSIYAQLQELKKQAQGNGGDKNGLITPGAN